MSQQRKSNSLKTRRSAILHFWNNGHRSSAAISRITKTPLRTVKYNIRKIKQQGTIEDRPRKGRPRTITASDSIALGQWIRRNSEATSKELAQKLLHDRGLNVSQWTVQRQLKRMGYKSTLPYGTPMLTQEQNHARVRWAIQHKDDNWSRTRFTDETCYQLFRNTIRRWSRNLSTEVKRIPKNKQKIMVWGVSASRASLVIIPLKQLRMAPTTFKIISFLMQEDNLVDDGDCNRIMILNIEVD